MKQILLAYKASLSKSLWSLRSYPKYLCLYTILSLCVGSIVAFFVHSLHWVSTYRDLHGHLIYWLPLSGLGIGFLYYYFDTKVQGGMNRVIRAIQHPSKERLCVWTAPLVYISTLTTHLFGGSAGREGTGVQMATALTAPLIQLFSLKLRDQRLLLISAVAAGFSAVFGTPLSGALFGLECFLIGRIGYAALLPAFFCAIVAERTAAFWHVAHSLYLIKWVPPVSPLTLVSVALAGMVFGVCAWSFSRLSHWAHLFCTRYIAFAPLRPFAGGVLVLGLAWMLGTTQYLGLSLPLLEHSFEEASSGCAFALKIIFTILTLSSGFKGGEVTPLFVIGATLGSMLSHFLPLPVGLLAGLGFVSVLAGATNTPLACIFMGMELFGTSVGVYVAIACVVAYFCSGHSGIYRSQLIRETKYRRRIKDTFKRLEDL